MDKNNYELFIQAINEGLSNRIDHTINECNVEIKPSKQHMLAMRTIVYGKGYRSKPLSPKARRIIAILIAAALLLTSCAVIYRNEIRGFIEEVTESFTRLSHSDEATSGETIENNYEFTYVPDGYTLEKTVLNPIYNKFIFGNSSGYEITLYQHLLDNSSFIVDNEEQILILTVDTYDIYYTLSAEHHSYLWNDGEYAMTIISDIELSDEELLLIVKGVKKE